eukprot:CAMPEP_0171980998 /NCGR_PEP_ID=MMETSP0993-20121228/264367_1 /TAXON_ID=483369 /ORGANISM="non described non described, Strain CCMP2098" /LENGTH=121 /DNA_ID=CAMNT_0012633373 /DNA_START=136 /DNA_END=501 /DNA_ORIENTATION=+
MIVISNVERELRVVVARVWVELGADTVERDGPSKRDALVQHNRERHKHHKRLVFGAVAIDGGVRSKERGPCCFQGDAVQGRKLAGRDWRQHEVAQEEKKVGVLILNPADQFKILVVKRSVR